MGAPRGIRRRRAAPAGRRARRRSTGTATLVATPLAPRAATVTLPFRAAPGPTGRWALISRMWIRRILSALLLPLLLPRACPPPPPPLLSRPPPTPPRMSASSPGTGGAVCPTGCNRMDRPLGAAGAVRKLLPVAQQGAAPTPRGRTGRPLGDAAALHPTGAPRASGRCGRPSGPLLFGLPGLPAVGARARALFPGPRRPRALAPLCVSSPASLLGRRALRWLCTNSRVPALAGLPRLLVVCAPPASLFSLWALGGCAAIRAFSASRP